MRTSDNMDTSDRIDRRTTTNVDILPNPRPSNEHRRHERCNCIRSPQPDGRAWRGRCGSGSSGVVPFRSLIDSSSPSCTLSQNDSLLDIHSATGRRQNGCREVSHFGSRYKMESSNRSANGTERHRGCQSRAGLSECCVSAHESGQKM